MKLFFSLLCLPPVVTREDVSFLASSYHSQSAGVHGSLRFYFLLIPGFSIHNKHTLDYCRSARCFFRYTEELVSASQERLLYRSFQRTAGVLL